MSNYRRAIKRRTSQPALALGTDHAMSNDTMHVDMVQEFRLFGAADRKTS
jgi:hypothetical protein